MSDTLERRIEWEPGFDCIRFECRYGKDTCKPGAGGSHGVHGLQIRWLVIGDKGAVQFLLFTNWMVEPERFNARSAFAPLPADLGYHSRTPQYEGQTPFDCEYVPDGKCYYDGSGVNAQEPFAVLCNDGIDALWAYLESYYQHVFEGGEFPRREAYRYAPRVQPDSLEMLGEPS